MEEEEEDVKKETLEEVVMWKRKKIEGKVHLCVSSFSLSPLVN